MNDVIKGRVWKFGDKIDTDVITPTKYMDLPMEELKKHALEPIRPNFHQQIKPGDVIVAGKNFGCGSSRESAAAVLKALEIGAVVAESFGRIFFRNAIANGIPVITCPQVSQSFKDGDDLELDLENAVVKNMSTGETKKVNRLSDKVISILQAGGIVPLLEKFGGK